MFGKRNVALYIRTARENDDAVERQEYILRKYAETHGYQGLLTYVDNGVSGISLDRPALGRLSTDILAGHIKAVFVKDISRLSRNSFEVHGWINGIRGRGVRFISIQDGITDDLFDNHALVYQYYLEHLERNGHRQE